MPETKNHLYCWWKAAYKILIVTGVIIAAASTYFSISKKPILTHTHGYDCYNKFISEFKLEIPKAPGIPVIVYSQTEITSSEYKTKPEHLPLRHFMNSYLKIFEMNASLTAIHQTEDTAKDKKCILLTVHDDINSKLNSLFPGINNYKIDIGFFASKDSVNVALATLARIHDTNFKQKEEQPLVNYRFNQYGNAITIVLEESKYGLKIDTEFEYIYDGQTITNSEEAFEFITPYNKRLFYTVVNSKVNSVFFPVVINHPTRRSCLKCHSLDNYCKMN